MFFYLEILFVIVCFTISVILLAAFGKKKGNLLKLKTQNLLVLDQEN